MRLAPADNVDPAELPAAQRNLVLDSAWASVTGSFAGGVIMVAFALSLGANAQQIGLMAAIPIIAQLAQLPATVLIERLRQRRARAAHGGHAARGAGRAALGAI